MKIDELLGNARQIRHNELISYNIVSGNPAVRFGESASMTQSLISQASLLGNSSLPSVSMDRFYNSKKDYTKEDAVRELWESETSLLVNAGLYDRKLNFSPSFNREAGCADILAYLEENGLSGEVDWSAVNSEFRSVLSRAGAENLGDCIDFLASRCVALSAQLERNCSGEELVAQQQKLDTVLAEGKQHLADSYILRLGDSLCFSSTDREYLSAAFDELINQRITAYQAAQSELSLNFDSKDKWLMNSDKYMAAQLRQSIKDISGIASANGITLDDLRLAGQIGAGYQKLYRDLSYNGKGSKEEYLAMNAVWMEMKVETLAQHGAVSGSMGKILVNSRQARHQQLLDVSDQRRETWRSTSKPSDGQLSDVNRERFQAVYDAVMVEFQRNGGNGVAAICKGVDFILRTTGDIGVRYHYEDFYKSYTSKGLFTSQSYTNASPYESYANRWNAFIDGLNLNAARVINYNM